MISFFILASPCNIIMHIFILGVKAKTVLRFWEIYYYGVMNYTVIRKQNISPDCFVCGVQNDFGLKAKSYECEREDGVRVLLTVFSGHFFHQSYPERLHGGITSTVLDEAIGRAINIGHDGETIWGVTIELSVKFRKPVPLEEDVYCETIITKQTHRSFEGEGKILLKDGTVCASGVGKYLILDPRQISTEGVTEKNWRYEDDEEMPVEFVIGG